VALAAGLRFLLSQQADDGAWRSQIYGPFKDGGSLTPLALRTLFGVAPRDRLDSNRIVAGISYLVRMVRDDGLIDSTSGNITYPVYTAANAVVVLSRSRNPRHLAARDAWLAELRRRQLVEQLGWQRDDEAYGGWGYSSLLPKRPVSGKPATPLDEPNLSATAFALEALRAAGSREDDPAFRKALRFVQRCQNFSNDRDRDRKVREGEAPAEPLSDHARLGGSLTLPNRAILDREFDDGGFFFILHDPIRNKAGGLGRDASGSERFASYGSTTADGLRCLLACGLSTDDPRVAAARRWLRDHFAADSHPGGYATDREHVREGLFLYYARSMALALASMPATDDASRAEVRRIASALANELARRQRPDGSWSNPVVSVREDDPLVATPFALEALAACRSILDHRPNETPTNNNPSREGEAPAEPVR
jgi:squalene-hopene/tetraprenyl-beta-curcumene cyclase